MSFASILFDSTESMPALERGVPAFFADLNLDQVVQSITAGREAYDLKPFFHTCLSTEDAVAYRHEVLRDFQNKDLHSFVCSFAEGMCEMRKQLAWAEKARYRYEKAAWFLDAVRIYCDAIAGLGERLVLTDLNSRGLLRFREYLMTYVRSDGFGELLGQARTVTEGLAAAHYCITIKGDRVKVSRYEGEVDYSAEVQRTFEKFRWGAVKDYRARFSSYPEMNHVEGRVLDLVAQLYPDEFRTLDEFCGGHADYVDEAIGLFDREVQFYLAYLAYIDRFTSADLKFCYPRISTESKEILARDAFDIALASKLLSEGKSVVCNDLHLKDPERIVVVSGPNQGGKTTFARMCGQLHYLAAIGCLVPGSEAQLVLFDRLFTHFEREEDIATHSGKLEDDLLRIHAILSVATSQSVVIMNESLTGTTLHDATVLGRAVLEQMIRQRLLCVYVTFVDELASLDEATVSMVSTVRPDDPTQRTYKIVRRPADGLAYAAAIAEKYGLGYEQLRGRLS